MTRESPRPAALEWQVFRGSAAVSAGLLSVHQLRASCWARLRHNVYADSRLARDHALACRATLVRLPPGSVVVAGPSAATAHGLRSVAGLDDPVHLIVLGDRRVGTSGGTILHRVHLDPVDVCHRRLPGGSAEVPVTTPARTAWDAAVWLPLTDAVAIADALLFHRLVTPDLLAEVAARLADRPGGRRAAHTLSLADAAAASRAESVLRVRLFLAGLPMARARPPVLAVRPPLAWPEYRVALWCAPDRHSETVMINDGWLVLRFSPQREFSEVVREVRAALTARGCRTKRKQDVVESALSPNMR
ncbi:hypothetical protein DFJ67_2646 [Asanoa ferruginea]|uniref:Transcriptional regulator with AbiEi antitoxin domain of type IV toxin-antitoxin system n=1 Tax=Asanoa ferruginea TaxID=53367 RepID=A0A3D9ZHD8_9ACTN|nr:hypothetical protein [Asanoa ferruginea]REF96657.1 hypothetical protein DFJ67_2646 [Asanoa ferruginea]GIF48960.1 hypothetical protein Afe04nite_34990 [Asanoa ferruginea]